MLTRIFLLTMLAGLAGACDRAQTDARATTAEFAIPYEKFELDNGLDVVFHVDRSDPVVAVALAAHVGSGREKTGRTGFAHLFEHLLFLESENLGKGGLDAMSARIGGSGANGFTTRDQTNYYQTVPKNALEKMIWAEADKLGWFINTVTDPVLAKEKQVVKNEKRQSVDNRPYGHTGYVIDKNLYPEGHPYNWQVIGSLEDLQNATVQDVKDFFNRWYVPNNVTLVVTGDFDPAEARGWVEQYFAEIPRGEEVPAMEARPGQLAATVKRFHEDNFARLPELTMVWPTVEQYHPDAYALDVLAQYLSDGKSAPLYKALVETAELTSEVSMSNRNSEVAGQTYLSVRAFEGVDLDSVAAVATAALAQFATTGISTADLDRIKAGLETDFYNGLSSVVGKAFQLAQYNTFAGDPGYISKELDNILAVTPADVLRVYETYFQDRPYVATSFVPQGQAELALTGSTRAAVVEEAIEQGAEEQFDASLQADYEPTPSTFDRSNEPAYGGELETTPPAVWERTLDNELKVYGITSNEVPLVNFDLVIRGGQLHDDLSKPGAANLLAELLNKGTADKTPEELEAAIQRLGSSLNVYADEEAIHLTGNALARNFAPTVELLREILLSPRWDEKELALLKKQIVSELEDQLSRPNAIANQAFYTLLYGEDDIRSVDVQGTPAGVAALTMEDLQNFYASYLSPAVAKLHVVGARDEAAVTDALARLTEEWSAKSVVIPSLPAAELPAAAKVYFYDVPGAKQSVLRIGYPSLAETDERFYPAEAMNYILGGGGFASRLTQELREGKGYTYGIYSRFLGGRDGGPFQVGTNVRSNITLEAATEIKKILTEYPETYAESDLETTKSSLIKGNARAFETARAKLRMLDDISSYGWAADYVKEREQTVRELTVNGVRQLADELVDPDAMVWLVVGDAATQLSRMEKLGYGAPVLLNP